MNGVMEVFVELVVLSVVRRDRDAIRISAPYNDNAIALNLNYPYRTGTPERTQPPMP